MTAATKEIWFLTGTQNLYGPETLEQVAQQSQKVVEQLKSGFGASANIVWKPILKTSDEIRRVMLDASAADQCIGVIAWMHTFSPAKM